MRRGQRTLPPQFADFDAPRRQQSSVQTIDICKATKSLDRLSIKAGRFCSLAIGGTKKHGRARSGTCSWTTANSCAVTKRTAFGKSRAFMTDHSDRKSVV